MDNKYENIVPWNGEKDTGRDVRLKLERNFNKIMLNFQEISDRFLNQVEIGEGVIKWDEKYNSFVLQKKDGTQANLIIQGGTSFYGNPTGVPTIFDGLPIDQNTIYWEDGILKAQAGGGGLSQVTVKLGESSYQSVDGVVSLPAYPAIPDLSSYALKTDLPDLSKYVTLKSEQEISGLKKFTEKIQIGDGVIRWDATYQSFVLESKDGTEANLIIQGGTSFYGNPTGVPTIFDGLPIDQSTIYWEDGILKAQTGGGGLSQVTVKLGESSYQSVDGVVSLPAYPTMPDLGKYVTLDTDQPINGIKTFGNYVQTNGFKSINNQLLFYDRYPNTWYTPNAIQTDDWYCNNKTNTGLYNAAEDARWYARYGRWTSDKDIYVNGYVYARYVNIANVVENVGDIFLMENNRDGFIRKSTWSYVQKIINQSQYTLDLRDAQYDPNTWYPCSIKVDASQCVTIKIFNALVGSHNKPEWATHPNGFTINLQWTVTGNGWGASVEQRTIKNNLFYFSSGLNPCGGIAQATCDSDEIVWLRGGGMYYYSIDNGSVINVHKDGYPSVDGSVFTPRTASQITDPSYSFRGSLFGVGILHTNGVRMYELPSVENTWNNRFNGSEGAIVQSTPLNGIYDQFITPDSYQSLIRWKNTIYGIGYSTSYAIGSSRDANGWGNLVFSVSSTDNGTNGYDFKLGGNGELIWGGNGTMHGSFYAAGVTSNDWVRVNAPGCGIFFSSHGGGIYMEDNTYVKVYNNKSLRVDGIISTGEAGADDLYGIVNVCRPHNLNNASCFSWIRSGTAAFAMGYNLNNEIVIGGGVSNRTVAPWLTVGSVNTHVLGNLIINGGTSFNASDVTEKDILGNYDLIPLASIVNTPVFKYLWKDRRTKHITPGTSAQYMQTVIPESTIKIDNRLKFSYDTSAFIFSVMVGRHLDHFITKTETNQEKMQKEIAQLKLEIEELKRRRRV